MKRYRGVRLCLNLLLSVLVLVMLWTGLGQPLPWEWAYRRMERAMFLEPMEILYHDEDGSVLSVDDKQLALYTGDFRGFPMFTEDLFLFPLENGLGRAIRKDTFFGMDIWAYDASGQSARVDMKLKIWRKDVQPHIIRETAQLEDGFFAIHVDENQFDSGSVDWRDTALEAMIAAETGINAAFGGWEAYEAGYAMTLTFYDEAGYVTAIHESEGTYAY